ncbi:MAG: glycosyltransferase family 2 protein [Thermovenabulum sp.]|uniref:glycosyltransferase family 2 protein n=1 Tax=Thermovenabulum sp. TaxID=3100335 RepID=UPI003C7C691F
MSVAAIIPAFNEERTVGSVLKTIIESGLCNEIILVSDGSTDSTSDIGRALGVKVIDFKKNKGKFTAVLEGFKLSNSDIILMIDADLVGLKKEHLLKLIEPIKKNEADMSIGIFKNGRGATDLAQKITPFLSGQRALKRQVLEKLIEYPVENYGLEMALTILAKRENLKVKMVDLYDLTHVMKEEKRGLLKGSLARLKMYRDVIKALIKLKFGVY